MPQNLIDGETFFLTQIPVKGESLEWKIPGEVLSDPLLQILVRAVYYHTPDSGEEFEREPLAVQILNTLPFEMKRMLLTCYPLTAMMIEMLDPIPNQPFDQEEIQKYQALAVV